MCIYQNGHPERPRSKQRHQHRRCASTIQPDSILTPAGIDIAHCKITSTHNTNTNTSDINIQLLSYTEIPITPDLRARVLALTRPTAPTTLADICDLNFALGEEFARAILSSGVNLSDIDIIANHGQTLWHAPNGVRKSTLQMSEPAVLAHATRK